MVSMGNPKRTFVKSIRAKRPDGSPVEIQEIRVSGTDPTATGTVWSMPMSQTFHRLATGEPVELYDDGTACVSDTGEMLVIS